MSELPWFLHDLRPGHYLSRPYIVLDFETTTRGYNNSPSALDPRNDTVMACWLDSGRMHTRIGGVFEQAELAERVQRLVKQRGVLVAHNAKFELQWLVRMGVDIDDLLVFDTQIAEYVLLGNLAAGDKKRGLPGMSISLDACCRRRGFPAKEPVVDALIRNGVCPSTLPESWLVDRCQRDVEQTHNLFLHQRQQLLATRRLGVQYTRCLLTPVLAQMEFTGMHLSAERVEAAHAEHTQKLRELEAEMDRLTGGISTRSPDQMAAFIYDVLGFDELKNARGKPKRTATGKRRTDADTIAALEPKTEKQRKFIDLRLQIGKVQAALSKSLDFYLGIVRERECLFHALINQTVTATHRLASSGIPVFFETFQAAKSAQFQNQAREFKRLFCARRPGWKSWEADGSQIEFRVAGHLGRDKQIAADVRNPEHDAHVFTASVLQAVGYAELYARYKNGDKQAKSWRQDAKSDTFKPLYGGEKGTPEQERYYQAFRLRYPELARTQENWLAQVLSTGALITEWGMRYFFPHAEVNRKGRCNVKSAVYNYPVQALATAEIVPIALVFLWHRVRRSAIRELVLFTNTVHDSAVGECAPEAAEPLREFCVQAFTHDVYRYLHKVYGVKFTVPLGVAFKAGDFWGEGEEITTDVEPPEWKEAA